jgi:hypothetical protein
MSTLEPLSELQARLSVFEAQAAQLNALRAADPGNATIAKLCEDVDKAAELTKSLIALHHGENNTVALEQEADEEPEKNAVDLSSGSSLKAGDIVQVQADGSRMYAGVIRAIDGNTARVKYFEYESEVLLPLDGGGMSRLPAGPVARADVKVGWKGECRYATDNKFYSASVEALTEHGAVVRYSEYGNVEEVPLSFLRPPPSSSSSSSAGAAAAGSAGVKLIPIPEYLLPKEADTEEEKAKKLKKIKAIKNKNRVAQKEQDQTQAQQSWQSFVNKGAKRGLSGVKDVALGASIFKSSDDLGAKVGVVNSGKGVTAVAGRKRAKLGPGALGSGEDDDDE